MKSTNQVGYIMNTPDNALFPGFNTGVLSNKKEYFIGLFADNSHPGHTAAYPAMLRKESDGSWVELDWRQPLWKDIQEEIDPASMMTMIVNDFNATLAKEMAVAGLDPADLNGDGVVEWVEKLARFHVANLRVDNDRLVFTV
jgi:hypothetical protein